MADKEFTLFELHFEDGLQFGPKVFSTGDDDAEVESEDDEETPGIEVDADGEGGGPLALLLGLFGLVVVAAVVRRLVGDDEDDDLEIEPAGDAGEDVEEFESAE